MSKVRSLEAGLEEGTTSTGGSWRRVEGGYVGFDEGLRFWAPSKQDIHRISARICRAANQVRHRISYADRFSQRETDASMLAQGGFKELVMKQLGDVVEMDSYIREVQKESPATR